MNWHLPHGGDDDLTDESCGYLLTYSGADVVGGNGK